MKKILIFIVGILGIGLSFCSAEDIKFSVTDIPFVAYSPTFDIYYSGNEFLYGNGQHLLGDSFSDSSIFSIVSFTGFNTPLLLNNICFDYNLSSYTLNFNGSLYSFIQSGNSYCVVFDSPVDLSLLNYSFGYNLKDSNNKYNFVYPRLSFTSNAYLTYYNNESKYRFRSFYTPLSYNNTFMFIDYSLLDNNSSLNFIQYSRVIPIFDSISLTILDHIDPIFRVNYGSTYYEYSLTDNLEIRLNSPVLKNGDNYSYAGSTGINLFFNGTSQFYNKPELYLYTPSWYSNNIFTPICL